MKRDNRRMWVLCWVLICLNLMFIWGNSLLPGTDSGRLSRIFSRLCSLEELEDLVRKLAHFTEFLSLGIWFGWMFRMQGQEKIHRFTMPFLCCLLAAAIDETIQAFVPGRGSRLTDVWIDGAGAAAGIIILLTGKNIFEKKKLKKSGGTKQ